MKRKRYSAEFRNEAAKMIIIEGVPVREVSEELGLPGPTETNLRGEALTAGRERL